MDFLMKHGISTRPGTHAVHMLSFYKNKYNIKSNDFPEAFSCDEQTMAIPLHNNMIKEDYEYVVETLKTLK